MYLLVTHSNYYTYSICSEEHLPFVNKWFAEICHFETTTSTRTCTPTTHFVLRQGNFVFMLDNEIEVSAIFLGIWRLVGPANESPKSKFDKSLMFSVSERPLVFHACSCCAQKQFMHCTIVGYGSPTVAAFDPRCSLCRQGKHSAWAPSAWRHCRTCCPWSTTRNPTEDTCTHARAYRYTCT